MNASRNLVGRLNVWFSSRAWVWIAGMAMSIVLLAVALLLILGRVADNSTKLSELRYRSCIEDSVLDFKIAEGSLIEAAFNRDTTGLAQRLPDYHDALTRLRDAQATCRTKFPD